MAGVTNLPTTGSNVRNHGQEFSSAFDHFILALPHAVEAWAEGQSRRLALIVQKQLSREPATGIFDDCELKSLWDEYSLQVQHGPAELDPAWSATVDPLIDFQLAQLGLPDAVLLTLARHWTEDDFQCEVDIKAQSPEANRRGVLERLRELADANEHDWISG